MKTQHFLAVLTALNLVLLSFLLLAQTPLALGLSFVGSTDTVRAQLHADRAESSLRLTNKAGRERLIEP